MKELLEYLYLEGELSTTQLAGQFGVHFTTISNWLIKFNIPRRTISETKIGRHNPMHGRTGDKSHLFGVHKFGKDSPHYKHGGTGEKIYYQWVNMRNRCFYSSADKYGRYRGRGIRVYSDWLDDFIVFERWALEHGYEDGLEIDRIDNDKGYFPDNVQFLTKSEHMKKTWKKRKS